MPTPTPLVPAKDLFRAALRDPLNGKAIGPWLAFARHVAPLWCLQPWAFADLHGSSVPSVYPLAVMRQSICADDGLPVGGSRQLTRLESVVDELRRWLVQAGWLAPSGPLDLKKLMRTKAPIQLVKRRSVFGRLTLLPLPDVDDEGYPDFGAAYERIGRRVMGLIESWMSATNRSERSMAKDEMAKYPLDLAHEIGAETGRGTKSIGPRAEVLRRFYQESKKLFPAVWSCLSEPREGVLGPVAVERLRPLGIAPKDAFSWVLRLTLPMLSAAETEALESEVARASAMRWGAKPTALRFTIWMLAHRLRLSAEHVAWKASGNEAKRYFHNGTNPIRPSAL